MALTKTPIELSSTPSIVDGGNATAITIDSSENVAIGGSVSISHASGDSLTLTKTTTEPSLRLEGNSNKDFVITVSGELLTITQNDGGTDILTLDHDTGAVKKPLQPAFLVKPANNNQTNVAINAYVTIIMGTEIFDQGGDFASNTCTAPGAGRYQINWCVDLLNTDTDSAYTFATLKTSNREYRGIITPSAYALDSAYVSLSGSVLADMDASDTAYVTIYQGGGAAQLDINGTSTYFSGFLAC